jgi:hypothetical protein
VFKGTEILHTRDSQTVHVQERVAHTEQFVRGMVKLLVLVMRQQLREIVLRALL